nr:nucleotide-binding alpha-beta plait domain-containing protein [Tanacetum cinerariifolium]
EQNKDNSDSKDEQFVGTIKDDFGGSDGEMEGENNVSVVSDTVREEENVKELQKGGYQEDEGLVINCNGGIDQGG